MSYFERKPERKGSLAEPLAKYEHGQFSVTAEEKERITKEALAAGKDPEEALREHGEKLRKATEILREKSDKKESE